MYLKYQLNRMFFFFYVSDMQICRYFRPVISWPFYDQYDLYDLYSIIHVAEKCLKIKVFMKSILCKSCLYQHSLYIYIWYYYLDKVNNIYQKLVYFNMLIFLLKIKKFNGLHRCLKQHCLSSLLSRDPD